MQFQKRSQLFISAYDETLAIAMYVSDPDRSLERTRSPIPIISRAAVGAGNPPAVKIILPAVVISVVTAPVTIAVVPSMVIISRGWRRNQTGDSEQDCEYLPKWWFYFHR